MCRENSLLKTTKYSKINQLREKPAEEADVSTTFIVFLTTCPSTSSPTRKQIIVIINI